MFGELHSPGDTHMYIICNYSGTLIIRTSFIQTRTLQRPFSTMNIIIIYKTTDLLW